MLTQIIIFIIFVIVICIVISSINYSGENNDMYKAKEVISKAFTLGNIKTDIVNNCHLINIKNAQSTTVYLIEGKFTNSCLSLYKNGSRIHSRIVSGERSFVFSSNLLLTSQIFKTSKYKSELLPLEDGYDYTVSVNNVNEILTKNYSVNYKIDKSSIQYTYDENIGVNEYDIIQQIQATYPNTERCNFRNVEAENKWVFKDEGNYILILVKNLFNIDFTLNDTTYTMRKNDEIPSYEIIEVTNPNIVAYNLDFKTKIKGINREYIEFITSPNHLMSKFLYGSKNKEIDYASQINDKMIILKLKTA